MKTPSLCQATCFWLISNKLLSNVDWLADSVKAVLNYSRRLLKTESFSINSLADETKEIFLNFEQISRKFLSKSKF